MKFLVKIWLIVILFFPLGTWAQSSSSLNERTPEQIASRLTEKLKEELKLSDEQSKQIYQINLKYALERQQTSLNRLNALKSIRQKDEEIKQVLTREQVNRLNSKKYSREQVDVDGTTKYIRTNPEQGSRRTSGETQRDNQRRSQPQMDAQRSRSDATETQRRNDVESARNRIRNVENSGASRTYERSLPSSPGRDNSSSRSRNTDNQQGGGRR